MTTTTPDVAEVFFNITGLAVCGVASNGTYSGDVVLLTYPQSCNMEFLHDEIDLQAGGLTVEVANIFRHVNFGLSGGALDRTAYNIMTGNTSSSSGSTPNQVFTTGATAGGFGTPYFGLVLAVAGVNGANSLFGLPRAKVTFPNLTVEQNTFVVQEYSGKGLASTNANSTFPNMPFIKRDYESAAALPASAAEFDTFFGVS
ncbi:MAG: hypothetical protein AAGK74_00150 [Chloroflexota bacterium]